MMVLRNVPTNSPTFSLLPAVMRSLGLGATDFERVSCPTLEISSRPRRGSKLAGQLQLSATNQAAAAPRRTDFHAMLHALTGGPLSSAYFSTSTSERRRGSVAAELLSRSDTRAFYVALAESMLPSGWLHFSVLECAGRPIAFHFGFEFRGRLYWYKPSFDPELARLSPGTVLLSYLIRDAVERD